MVGESRCRKDIYQLITKVAATASTVLINGESGTGKELAARDIHQSSSRRKMPFVAVNCATLTEPLPESELFGHERGAFIREDLYFRLNVVALRMPPLRDRAEDVWLLANYFAAKYAEKCKRHIAGIAHEASRRLPGYSWPGNVRELENAIERVGSSDLILAEDLPETLSEMEQGGEASRPLKFCDLLREAKKSFVLNALRQAGGD